LWGLWCKREESEQGVEMSEIEERVELGIEDPEFDPGSIVWFCEHVSYCDVYSRVRKEMIDALGRFDVSDKEDEMKDRTYRILRSLTLLGRSLEESRGMNV